MDFLRFSSNSGLVGTFAKIFHLRVYSYFIFPITCNNFTLASTIQQLKCNFEMSTKIFITFLIKGQIVSEISAFVVVVSQ